MSNELICIADIDVAIKRTKRVKSVSLKIVNGEVFINVPQRLSNKKIEQLIRTKISWIKGKLDSQSATLAMQYQAGELLSFCGLHYRLRLEVGEHRRTVIDGNELIVTLPNDQHKPHLIRNALICWYKIQASEHLISRIELYSKMVGRSPNNIAIKTFRARWGSCSQQKNIDFTWHLMMAPPEVIDYVVVHELCHLIEMNHSKAFWALVENVIPDYRVHKLWLKQYGQSLLTKMRE